MKKIAGLLRKHPELIRAQKMFPSGVVEGLNNKAKVIFAPTAFSNSRYITHLASCPNRNDFL